MNDIEIKILESAKKYFVEKGYQGTSIREIAKEAEVNVAMVNYYFRSKENLFRYIFIELYEDLLKKALDADSNNLSLYDKINLLISFIIDTIIKDPTLPFFMLTEVNRNPEAFLSDDIMHGLSRFITFFTSQIEEEVAAKRIRPIDTFTLYINIISMSVLPFLGAPLIIKVMEYDEDTFCELMQKRKKEVLDFVLKSLEYRPD